MGNAKKIPMDLVLQIIDFLEVPELYNLGLASKDLYAFTHPALLRIDEFCHALGSTFPFVLANNKRNLSTLTMVAKWVFRNRSSRLGLFGRNQQNPN